VEEIPQKGGQEEMKGNVRDIRTGRAMGRSDDLADTFIDRISTMRRMDVPCYVVTGPCRHLEMRTCVDLMRQHGIIVIIDRQFKPDTFWLFEGDPSELGFAV
jgi:hypothetical protein